MCWVTVQVCTVELPLADQAVWCTAGYLCATVVMQLCAGLYMLSVPGHLASAKLHCGNGLLCGFGNKPSREHRAARVPASISADQQQLCCACCLVLMYGRHVQACVQYDTDLM
jgi:hypothetical protein